MKKIVLTLALLCCGCQQPASPPPATAKDALVDRVWIRADASDLPGRKLIFLSDGTLVQDSCWETYRLSKWTRAEPNRLRWSEDGRDVEAEIRTLADNELVLKLVVPDEPEEQRFAPATVPYVCPDMNR